MVQNKRIAIMQPYFLPYIGYWQLMSAVDTFVVYDDIQYTKKGWINRNRILQNGMPATISVPVSAAPTNTMIVDRHLSSNFDKEGGKLVRRVASNYSKAPYFEDGLSLFRKCINAPSENLFSFLYGGIREVASALGIAARLVRSSTVSDTSMLRSQDRVLQICVDLGAGTYINPISGEHLYDRKTFKSRGIDLRFQKTREVSYRQFGQPFCEHLSVLDVIMFCGFEKTRGFLGEMDLK